MEINPAVLEKLKALHSRDRLPSTLLFAGESGSGKLKTAKALATELLGLSSESALVNHPDFNALNCADREEVNTESIKSLLYSLHLKNFSAENRVVVLENCEELHTQATNALLKSLEEPPSRLFFVLCSANRQRILPTVLSRCQVWFFSSSTRRTASEEEQELQSECAELIKSLESGKSEAFFLYAERNKGLKDKELLRSFIRCSIESLREGVESNPASAEPRARLMENLIFAEPYLLDRNLSPQNLLGPVFRSFAEGKELSAEHLEEWLR